MPNTQPFRIKTISEYHRLIGLPKPEHPLISIVNFEDVKLITRERPSSLVFDFYSVAMKRNWNEHVKFKYGQQQYDFEGGILFFMSPNQVFSIETDEELKHSGWMLLLHPDFFWNTSLAKNIKQYEYFDYAVNEALHLSDKEENVLLNIIQNIQQEYHSTIDTFSQSIIIAQLEVLLSYADRFYQRQFITRKIANHQILHRLDNLLAEYFNSNDLLEKGLPTVQFVAKTLNVSPNYLSGLLKTLTGQNTQQHIHNHLIEKAKEKLSTSDLSIGEIAYELGFEHSQSFSKLFKTKTKQTPLEFRAEFN